MKKALLSASIFGLSVGPAFAGGGGGGATTDVVAFLVQTVGRLVGKLTELF